HEEAVFSAKWVSDTVLVTGSRDCRVHRWQIPSTFRDSGSAHPATLTPSLLPQAATRPPSALVGQGVLSSRPLTPFIHTPMAPRPRPHIPTDEAPKCMTVHDYRREFGPSGMTSPQHPSHSLAAMLQRDLERARERERAAGGVGTAGMGMPSGLGSGLLANPNIGVTRGIGVEAYSDMQQQLNDARIPQHQHHDIGIDGLPSMLQDSGLQESDYEGLSTPAQQRHHTPRLGDSHRTPSHRTPRLSVRQRERERERQMMQDALDYSMGTQSQGQGQGVSALDNDPASVITRALNDSAGSAIGWPHNTGITGYGQYVPSVHVPSTLGQGYTGEPSPLVQREDMDVDMDMESGGERQAERESDGMPSEAEPSGGYLSVSLSDLEDIEGEGEGEGDITTFGNEDTRLEGDMEMGMGGEREATPPIQVPQDDSLAFMNTLQNSVTENRLLYSVASPPRPHFAPSTPGVITQTGTAVHSSLVRSLSLVGASSTIVALCPGHNLKSYLYYYDSVTMRPCGHMDLGHIPDLVCSQPCGDNLVAVGSSRGVSICDTRTSQFVAEVGSLDRGWGVRSLSYQHSMLTVGGGSGRIGLLDPR
ncbi:hypothetical protein KIPB_009154, partial [Kipferlia bialata]